MFVLPSFLALGLVYFPYHWSFKIFTAIPATMMFTRYYNRSQDPEIPETFVRELLHTHEELKDLFKVETTSTLDFNVDWVKGIPSEKFPEFDNKLFKFFSSETYMTTGEYTFGDVESNSTVTIKFKTMPVRRTNRYLVGEPYFFYSMVAEVNQEGEYKKIVIVDEKEALKRHRPHLLF